jgi:predicted DNA-binding protein (MmcQ/YjbR family)
MDLEALQRYLRQKPGATEERPFGPEVLVYKVMGKIFALVAWEVTPLRLSLKCDPDFALALRDQYTAVQPGYHLNKKHWNTLTLDGGIPEEEVWSLLNHSYELVVRSLKKADQALLQQEAGKTS